ncbi:MAG TPA: hypothetical protein VLE20_00530 [Blastocatellia bacterium]|nr:hypothetical protein [Blastocatellia bacterium]
MPNAIAFFPWISTDSELVVNDIRLLPYERGRKPGDQAGASQKNIDAILAAYANRKDEPIEDATLLEAGDCRFGSEFDARFDDLFRVRDLIAFAALAERRLFRGHFDYTNTHCYVLVVQSYDPNHLGNFTFTTRRRDGHTANTWATDDFAFYRPLHVDRHARLKIDLPLLAALQFSDQDERLPHDAIAEFNAANTDSPDIPIHTEVVMTKSAFEFLFGIGNRVEDFVDALFTVVPAQKIEPELEGPLKKTWLERRRTDRLLEAWAREFCDLRGSAAHGKDRGGARFVWSPYSHLAFTSLLFPLLLKQRLATDGFLQLKERDAIELEMIEAYLTHEPMARPTEEARHEHPWERIYSEGVLGMMMHRHLKRELSDLWDDQ